MITLYRTYKRMIIHVRTYVHDYHIIKKIKITYIRTYHNPVHNIKGFIFFQPSNFLLGKMADNEKIASASRSTQKEGEFGLHLSVDYKIIHPSSLPFSDF